MRKYIFQNKLFFSINIFFIFLVAFIDILKAYIFGDIIDTLTMGESIISLLYISVSFIFISFFLSMICDIIYEKFCNKVLVSLRKDLIEGILNTEIYSFNKNLSSRYINNISNDINIIYNDYICNLKDIFYSVLSFCLALIMLFNLDIIYGLSIIILSIIPLILNKLFINSFQKCKKEYSNSVRNLISKSKNILDGYTVIKGFGIEKKIFNLFNNININTEDYRYKSKVKEYFISNLNGCISLSIFISILLIGAYMVSIDRITIGQMIIASQLSNNIVNPLKSISILNSKMKSVDLIYKSLEDTINLKNINYYGYTDKSTFDKIIKINNLTFSYDSKNTILKDINLNLEKGKMYAFIGSSGSGKSTLGKIIQGFYKNYSGNIMIDSTNLKDLTKGSISKLITSIDQDIFLFNDTIKNNICLFDDYEDDKINDAIFKSGLKDTIKNLEFGLNTEIVENGSNLSGGEKQRIAIARSILVNTPILILDESTSALDINTRTEIEKTLLSLTDKTILFITHQIDTLYKYKFDEIISFNEYLIDKNDNLKVTNIN